MGRYIFIKECIWKLPGSEVVGGAWIRPDGKTEFEIPDDQAPPPELAKRVGGPYPIQPPKEVFEVPEDEILLEPEDKPKKTKKRTGE